MTEQSLPQESIFLQALEIPSPAERAGFLDRACGENGDMRAEVEALLRANARSGDLLDLPEKPAATIDQPYTERPGTVIGPYKLLEQIGEGGFGVVFMAEQQEPIRRRVALKVIKPGMETRQVIARFEAERQALALMDHPNIAKVLDAGTTGTVASDQWPVASEDQESPALVTSHSPLATAARPFFVMELVKGVPITEYCDQNQLTTRERLELFIPVCHAVQHAHQKGIIHRDIKPSNVMVTLHDGTPVVKVIDFGIAKAMGQQLSDKTLFTNFAQMIGTPLYMSPEQAGESSLDIDTRSDIYSLGVLLYELLTGTTPFDKERFKVAGYDEMRRIVREEEPPKPSTRISTLGQAATTASMQRKSDPKRLSQLVRGELDWIVMKCLEKDRNRRYETASAFAADVQRYLHDEPVQACPPSAAYRLRKFARRNKTALAMASVIAAALLLIVGTVGWMVRDRAVRHARVSGQVELILADVERLQEEQKWPEALAAARRAEAALASGEAEPTTQARVRQAVADLDMERKLEQARLEEAIAFDTAETDGKYAEAFREYGIDVEALAPTEAARQIQARGIRLELAAALDNWARSRRARLRESGQEKADASWKQFLAVARAVDRDPWRNRLRDALERDKKAWDRKAMEELAASAPIDQVPATTLGRLGAVLREMGATEQAVVFLRKAQQRHPADFWINLELAIGLYSMQPPRLDEAIGYNRAALALRPRSSGVYVNLGAALTKKGLLDEAIAALKEAIRLKPDNALAHNNLGTALSEKGLLDEPVACYKEALRLKPDCAEAHDNLGSALKDKGLLDEAIAAHREAIRLKPDLDGAHNKLGVALAEKGRLDDAIAAYREAIRLKLEDYYAHDNLGSALKDKGLLDEAIAAHREAIRLKPDYAPGHNNLGNALTHKGLLDEAIVAYREALRLKPDLVEAHGGVGIALAKKGRLDEAVGCFKETIRLKPNDPLGHYQLGLALAQKGDWEEAIACYKEGIRLKPDLAMAHYNLGLAFLKKDSLDDAIPALKEAIRLKPDLAVVHYHLGYALQTDGRLDEAIACYKKAIELNPKDSSAHNNLGNILYVQGKLDEAIDYHKEVIRLNPDSHFGPLNLGSDLEAKGLLDEAIAAYREAVRLSSPGSPMSCVNLARALARKGPSEEATAAYQKAIRFDGAAWLLATWPDPKLRDPSRAVELAKKWAEGSPNDINAWHTLCVAHYRAGDWKAAIEAVEKARELPEERYTDCNAFFFLAMAHWQLGNKPEARQCYDQAVQWMEKNKPHDEELRRFQAEAAELLSIKNEPTPPQEAPLEKK